MEDSIKKIWEKYPAALPEGSILAGQYIIQDVLGQGGFGITYLAEDYKLKMKVAVKEFFPESMVMRQGGVPEVTVYSDGKLENFHYGMQSFLDEARVLAQFQGNPNVVGVRSYFEENGTAYFVMDYIEGINFKTYIQRHGGNLGWEETCNIMLPVMNALIEVHQKGIIHRDVTPDNILIANDHTVKLLDFGAARYSLGDRSQSLDVVLKAGYAPKEQYTRRGKQGPYTDVYSVAACFYTALCGYLPPESLDRMDKDEIVSLSARGVQLPKSSEKAIVKGLEVRPENRFQSMDEFKHAVMGEVAPNPVPGIMEKLKQFLKKHRVAVAGAMALILTAIVIYRIKAVADEPVDNNYQADEGVEENILQSNSTGNPVPYSNLVEDGESIEEQEDNTTEKDGEEKKQYSNILMEEEERDRSEEPENLEGVLGNYDLKPALIRKVNFLNLQENVPENAWDVSSRKDGSVMAWADERDDGGFDLSIAAEGNVIIESGKYLFCGYKTLEEISFNNCLDTSRAMNMQFMFRGCEALQELDVSGFDTGSVTDMAGMFENCSRLKNIDVSGFDTSKVTDMGFMFSDCEALQELDVSGFDTGSVKTMRAMFHDCNHLQELDVRSFDTSLVIDMAWMFAGCRALQELDVISFNTSRVTDMQEMFNGCKLLEELDVSEFDTSWVTNMRSMFCNCNHLQELDVSSFNTSQVTDMGYMFYECSLLRELDADGFDIGQVTNMDGIFVGCEALQEYPGWYE